MGAPLTHAAIASINAALNAALDTPLNSGFMEWYSDNALTGTVSVTNGSASVTFSTAQTLAAGEIIQFASQPGVYYTLQSAVTASTAGTLGVPGGATTNYTGTTNGATTSGTRPGSPDVALKGGNTKLCKLPLSATAFAPASAGSKVANAITSAVAIATGTATFFRGMKSDDATGVIDGSIGTSGCDLNLGTTSIVSGATCSCSSWTVTMPQ